MSDYLFLFFLHCAKINNLDTAWIYIFHSIVGMFQIFLITVLLPTTDKAFYLLLRWDATKQENEKEAVVFKAKFKQPSKEIRIS